MHQDRVDLERLFQFFNTHGAEVTPGSDVVGEDLQRDLVAHNCSLRVLHPRFMKLTGALVNRLAASIVVL
jgi:hypothetical protein